MEKTKRTRRGESFSFEGGLLTEHFHVERRHEAAPLLRVPSAPCAQARPTGDVPSLAAASCSLAASSPLAGGRPVIARRRLASAPESISQTRRARQCSRHGSHLNTLAAVSHLMPTARVATGAAARAPRNPCVSSPGKVAPGGYPVFPHPCIAMSMHVHAIASAPSTSAWSASGVMQCAVNSG